MAVQIPVVGMDRDTEAGPCIGESDQFTYDHGNSYSSLGSHSNILYILDDIAAWVA